MKYWRTLAVATVALFAAATAFAAMAPKAPAAAGPAKSCEKNTDTAAVFPLVMPADFQDTTSTNVGNGFPWENSTFFFASFRNQYLYPSDVVDGVYAASNVMRGIHARSVSFTGANTNVYGAGPRQDSFVSVTDAVSGSLVPTFSANALPGSEMCRLDSSAGTFTIGTANGPGGALLSTCTTCTPVPGYLGPAGGGWCMPGDISPASRPFSHILLDHLGYVAGGSGYAVWDTCANSCGTQRGYGSGSFVNPNHLTTAYGIDGYDFIWVFEGVGKPPAATVEQQIKEIIRLLLTPQGLRCSGLDLVPGDGVIEDHPITFPNGKYVDPIQPQITSGGMVTGDEMQDGMRSAGWKP